MEDRCGVGLEQRSKTTGKMKLQILICIVLLTSSSLKAQEEEIHSIQMEQLAEQQEQEPELDDLLSLQEDIARNQVSIYKLQTDVLVSLGLNPIQIRAFENYVLQFGYPQMKYELQAIPYWNRELIRRLLPYLDFSPQPVFFWKQKRWYKEASHQLLIRTGTIVEKSKAYSKDSTGLSKYIGSPQRVFIRYGYQVGRDVYAGFSLEKDAGEKFAEHLYKPSDFTGFHLFIKGKGALKEIAVGDFMINAGQGLVVWQGMAFGKGAAGAGVFRQGALLRPYRSAGEINFFRGAALRFSKGKWEQLTWISNRKRSASIIREGGEPVAFSSLSTSGYHRTDTEIASRNKLNEFVTGMVLQWKHKNWRIGLNSMYQRFSIPWLPREQPYSIHFFRGRQSLHNSLDYSFGKKQFFVFGELAKGGPGLAMVQGLVASISQRVDLTMVYRNFQPSYHSVYANALSEQATVRNEEGFYANLECRPATGWQVKLYADWFRFPWLRFRSDAPGSGLEGRLMVQWEKRKKWIVYGYLRWQSKRENTPATFVNSPEELFQHNFRLHLQRQFSKSLIVSSRLDAVGIKQLGAKQKGRAAYADAKWILPENIGQLAARVQWFRTGGYATRIYSYERDLLYSYSIPAVFDHGWRYYLQWQGKWKISWPQSANLKWWIRWSRTRIANQDSMGSGWDEIPGNRRSEWKFQLILDW